ncbi:MAG: hypothetical protein IKZ55_11325 [Bacteroidales bacterium]|nr:hypothetical protein [Bacteroidales bacterium]
MKRYVFIGLIALLLLASCTGTTRKARKMVRRAEHLADTLPDSTLRLIDSVLRMEVYFSERERIELAMLQGDVLFGHHDTAANSIPPLMDDEYFDDKPFFSTSPELERAAAYFARKKKYDRAATAALYSGFVQQHYGENKIAMQSFKDAEQYGDMAGDSLAVALAQCKMGKLLYGNHLYDEALVMFQSAENKFGNHLSCKALAQNMQAVCHLMVQDLGSAEDCLKQSLLLAEQGHINKVKHKVLNNYAVLYRQQGRYDKAKEYLKKTIENHNLIDPDLFVYYLNMGKTFFAVGELDSATVYFQNIEELLPCVYVKNETKLSSYGALSRFAKTTGNNALALQYQETHEKLLYEVLRQSQEQNVYRIQRQYDYETIQNALSRKIISRHRIIIIFSVLLVVSAVVILILQFRHKQMREAEAEMKLQIDSMKQDLQQMVKPSVLEEEVAMRLKMMLSANRISNRSKDPKNEWQPLVNQVMNGKENLFEAARATIEVIYPNLFTILLEKYPNLSETETKVCLLSFCDISNTEIGDLLGLKPNTINQIRSTLRKKMNLNSDKMKEQLRNALSD